MNRGIFFYISFKRVTKLKKSDSFYIMINRLSTDMKKIYALWFSCIAHRDL